MLKRSLSVFKRVGTSTVKYKIVVEPIIVTFSVPHDIGELSMVFVRGDKETVLPYVSAAPDAPLQFQFARMECIVVCIFIWIQR